MHYMTFVEDSEDANRIAVFPNGQKKVCIEISTHDDDPMMYQNIALSKADIQMLIKELQRIITEYEVN